MMLDCFTIYVLFRFIFFFNIFLSKWNIFKINSTFVLLKPSGKLVSRQMFVYVLETLTRIRRYHMCNLFVSKKQNVAS